MHIVKQLHDPSCVQHVGPRVVVHRKDHSGQTIFVCCTNVCRERNPFDKVSTTSITCVKIGKDAGTPGAFGQIKEIVKAIDVNGAVSV